MVLSSPCLSNAQFEVCVPKSPVYPLHGIVYSWFFKISANRGAELLKKGGKGGCGDSLQCLAKEKASPLAFFPKV